MKKHLLAVAVGAAIAAPAIAQNVTLSGYAEIAFESADATTAKTTNLASGGFGSSRIVISGSEDLGGGLKAGFRAESTVNWVTGQLGTASLGTGTQAATSPIFDRGVEVNLSGAFGTLAFGKLDHGGIENNDINVFGNQALAESTDVEVSGIASDANGTIRYTTPTFNGISVNVAYTPSDASAANTVAASKAHGGIQSIQATGKLMGVDFRVGQGKVKKAQTGAGNSLTADTDVIGLGASYDFGIASAAFYYQKQDNPTGTRDSVVSVATVKVPLGNGLDVRGLVERIDEKGVSGTNDEKNMQVALFKALSKRTSVYASYRSVDVATTTAGDVKTTSVGVAHSF
jgi:predicted porin